MKFKILTRLIIVSLITCVSQQPRLLEINGFSFRRIRASEFENITNLEEWNSEDGFFHYSRWYDNNKNPVISIQTEYFSVFKDGTGRELAFPVHGKLISGLWSKETLLQVLFFYPRASEGPAKKLKGSHVLETIYHKPTRTLYIIVRDKFYNSIKSSEHPEGYFFTEYRDIAYDGNPRNFIFLTPEMAKDKGIPLK